MPVELGIAPHFEHVSWIVLFRRSALICQVMVWRDQSDLVLENEVAQVTKDKLSPL